MFECTGDEVDFGLMMKNSQQKSPLELYHDIQRNNLNTGNKSLWDFILSELTRRSEKEVSEREQLVRKRDHKSYSFLPRSLK